MLLLACTPPPAHLWLGGDLHLGPHPEDPLFNLAALVDHHPGIVNLEGAVTDHPRPDGLRLSNPPAVLSLLRHASIVAVGLSNNHADDGPPADLSVFSAAHLATSRDGSLATLSIDGRTLGFSAWDLTNGVPSGLLATLREQRSEVPALLVSFHVTGPPSYLPRPELRSAVDQALEAGASVVMAQGTHVLGPLERHGSQLVAWGLGNLAFACDCTDQSDSMILEISLTGATVGEVEVIPLRAGLQGQPIEISPDPKGIFDLLEAIGTPRLELRGDRALLPESPR